MKACVSRTTCIPQNSFSDKILGKGKRNYFLSNYVKIFLYMVPTISG